MSDVWERVASATQAVADSFYAMLRVREDHAKNSRKYRAAETDWLRAMAERVRALEDAWDEEDGLREDGTRNTTQTLVRYYEQTLTKHDRKRRR